MGFSNHKNLPYYLLQIKILIYSCLFIFSVAIDTIRINESLGDSDALISNGNKFKLSFFSPPNSSKRYVGIMFNLPVMTVVWVANRDTPLNDYAGTLEISSDGNLVILNGRKEIVWTTNLSTSAVIYSAVLLDSGNLVLQDNSNNSYVWESFQHASDSWLEEMRIFTDVSRNEKNALTSWSSPYDPAPGSFTLTIEPSDIPQTFVWKDGNPYWRSGPWNGQIFTGIPYMKSDFYDGANVFSDSRGTASSMFTLSNSSILLYTALNSSGSVEEKMWSVEKRRWDVTWSSTSNECDIYGRCGPYGSCNAGDRPICTCFPGYAPIHKAEWEAGNWTSGCTRKYPIQCEHNTSLGEEDGFQVVEGVKLPDHFELLPSWGQDCGGACLNNCSCIAYADPTGIGCLHWTRSLIDTQKFSDGGEDLYIRLAYSELHKKQDRTAIIAATVVSGAVLIAVCAYFLPKLLSSYRARMPKNGLIYSEKRMLKHGVKLEELPLLKFEMLLDATGNFDPRNELGQGGFGLVYKGKLPNGQEIAVKRLERSSNQGVDEFMNEVEVISRLQHRNLVRLLGCCVESDEKLLVYEYMPNGSLDACLFDSYKQEFLDWPTRKIIIEGICRGLLYLHRDSRLKIIHRDLKASNILLDEELNPKISDFGMARIFGRKNDQANTTRVVGTYGYMAPEYALRGILSDKSDVYSFGVLLLEIVSGKKSSSFYDEDQQLFLIAYAWKLWNEGNVRRLMDGVVYDVGVEGEVMRYVNVGLLCVQETAADRPNISTVLSMLGCEIVELPQPKQPAFIGMQMAQTSESSTKRSSKDSVNDITISVVQGR